MIRLLALAWLVFITYWLAVYAGGVLVYM